MNIVFSQIELGATDSALSVVTEINTPVTSDGTVSNHHDDSKNTTGQIQSPATTGGRPVQKHSEKLAKKLPKFMTKQFHKLGKRTGLDHPNTTLQSSFSQK